MKPRHTPGPWSAQRIHAAGICISAPGKPELARVHDVGNVTTEEADANAALIEAAPESLAALEYLLQRYLERYAILPRLHADAEKEKAVIDARAAIAKATAP